MRPDEHKKKKNEQYKKKHGLSGKKTTADSSSKPSKTQTFQKADQVVQEKYKVEPVKNETSTSEEDTPVRRPQFDRREVSSNWHRYEEEIADQPGGSTTAKGTDFEQLLANTGNSLSQFRFKDEHLWEDTDDHSESTSSFLSINCDQLLTAVKCVPVHQRLGIDAHHFQVNQIETLKMQSEKNLSEYKYVPDIPNDLFQNTETDSPANNVTSINTTDISDITENTSKDIPITETLSSKESLNSNKCDVSTAESSIIQTEELSPECKTDDRINLHLNNEKSVENTFSDTGGDNDLNELDDILALSETPMVSTGISNKMTVSNNSSSSCAKKPISLEDQLDELLDLEMDDSPQKIPDNVETERKVEKDDSNLEDWLDSVLDD